MENKIIVRHLKKYFKEAKAVDDISFEVQAGELFGFLGENGAGKTTAIRMLCTLLALMDGEITICGFRVGEENFRIRKRIGIVWQNNCLDEKLTVKENLVVRASLYGMSKLSTKEKIKQLSEQLQLQDIFRKYYGKLSGGQKRRCEIAAALLHTPEILFLDEPTTGLDPSARKCMWECLEELRHQTGMTVFLTTHYMEEAAKADHIAIISEGRIIARGTPDELRHQYRISGTLDEVFLMAAAAAHRKGAFE